MKAKVQTFAESLSTDLVPDSSIASESTRHTPKTVHSYQNPPREHKQSLMMTRQRLLYLNHSMVELHVLVKGAYIMTVVGITAIE